MLKFTKMEAYGNDYIYIDVRKEKIEKIEELARMLTNRHFGIGGDGLVLIDNSLVADYKMRIFNPDGTEAEMCGNAIRCVAKYIYTKINKKKSLTIETLGGIKTIEILGDLIKTNLGIPEFSSKLIPVVTDKEKFINENITILDKEFLISCLSWGNPHAVIIVDDVDNFDVLKYGPLIENYKISPKRTNVTFVSVINENTLKIREWERGVGETISCTTGSAAAMVITYLLGLTKNKCEVKQTLGTLDIEFDTNNQEVYVMGSCNFVFEGVIYE